MLLLGIILIITGILGMIYCSNIKWLNLFFGTYLVGVVLLIIGIAIPMRNPQAIDVYRNRTTLEITYRDSIPVDSIVVWKQEFKK